MARAPKPPVRASTWDRQAVGGARRPTGGRSAEPAGGARGAAGRGRAMAEAATNGEAASSAAGSCARGLATRGVIRACDAAEIVSWQLQAARQAAWRGSGVGRDAAQRRSGEPGASQQQIVAALEQIRPSQRHSVMLAESRPGATKTARSDRTTNRRRRLMMSHYTAGQACRSAAPTPRPTGPRTPRRAAESGPSPGSRP